MMKYLFIFLLSTQILVSIIMVLMSVAFFSLLERKILSLIQSRIGPNKVSIGGVLQPISDALKLMSKQNTSPNFSGKFMYWVSPCFFFMVSILLWILSPLLWEVVSFKSGVMFMISCLSMLIYGLIFSGWFANSKYASIGSIRSIAQMISYEIILSFVLFLYIILCNSFDLKVIESFNSSIMMIFPFFPIFMVMIISMYAESNRTPFDLPEGESELVSGFCVEYGSVSYTLIFLSENSSLLMSGLIVMCLFFGNEFMIMKLFIIFYLFVWTRGTFPRIRWDTMMSMCWQMILPFLISIEMMYFITS